MTYESEEIALKIEINDKIISAASSEKWADDKINDIFQILEDNRKYLSDSNIGNGLNKLGYLINKKNYPKYKDRLYKLHDIAIQKKEYNTQPLANILNAFSKILPADQSEFEKFRPLIEYLLELACDWKEFNDHEISNILNAIVKWLGKFIEFSDCEYLIKHLCCQALKRKFNIVNIAIASNALSKLPMDLCDIEPIIQTFCASAQTQLEKSAETLQNYTLILNALCCLCFNHDRYQKYKPFIDALYKKIKQVFFKSSINGINLSNLLWCFAILKSLYNHNFEGFDLFVEKIMGELNTLVTQKYKLILKYNMIQNLILAIKVFPQIYSHLKDNLRTIYESELKKLSTKKPDSSNTHANVFQTLQKTYPEIQFKNEYFEAPYFIDIVCFLRDTKIAIQIDGPSHYKKIDGNLKPVPKTLMRDHMLTQVGWKIIVVPCFEWDNQTDKITYLKNKFDHLFKPQLLPQPVYEKNIIDMPVQILSSHSPVSSAIQPNSSASQIENVPVQALPSTQPSSVIHAECSTQQTVVEQSSSSNKKSKKKNKNKKYKTKLKIKPSTSPAISPTLSPSEKLENEIQQFVDANHEGVNIDEKLNEISAIVERKNLLAIRPMYEALLYSSRALFLAIKGNWKESVSYIKNVIAIINQKKLKLEQCENLFQRINTVLMTLIYHLLHLMQTNDAVVNVLKIAMSDFVAAHINIENAWKNLPENSKKEMMHNVFTFVRIQSETIYEIEDIILLIKPFRNNTSSGKAFCKKTDQAYLFYGLMKIVSLCLMHVYDCVDHKLSCEQHPLYKERKGYLEQALRTCNGALTERPVWQHNDAQRHEDMSLVVLAQRLAMIHVGELPDCLILSRKLEEYIVSPWSKLKNTSATEFLIYQFFFDNAACDYHHTKLLKSFSESHEFLATLLMQEELAQEIEVHQRTLFSGLLHLCSVHIYQYRDSARLHSRKIKLLESKERITTYLSKTEEADWLTDQVKLALIDHSIKILKDLLHNYKILIGSTPSKRAVQYPFPPFLGLLEAVLKSLSDVVIAPLLETWEKNLLSLPLVQQRQSVENSLVMAAKTQKLYQILLIYLNYFIKNPNDFLSKERVVIEFRLISLRILKPGLILLEKEIIMMEQKKKELSKLIEEAEEESQDSQKVLEEKEEKEKKEAEEMLEKRCLLAAQNSEKHNQHNTSSENTKKEEEQEELQSEQEEGEDSDLPTVEMNIIEEDQSEKEYLNKAKIAFEALKRDEPYRARGIFEQMEKMGDEKSRLQSKEGKFCCDIKILNDDFKGYFFESNSLLYDYNKNKKNVSQIRVLSCCDIYDQLLHRYKELYEQCQAYKLEIEKIIEKITARPSSRLARKYKVDELKSSIDLLRSFGNELLYTRNKCSVMDAKVQHILEKLEYIKVMYYGLEEAKITELKVRANLYQLAYDDKVINRPFSETEKKTEAYKQYLKVYNSGAKILEKKRSDKKIQAEIKLKEQLAEESSAPPITHETLVERHNASNPEVKLTQAPKPASLFKISLTADELISLIISKPTLSKSEIDDIRTWTENNKDRMLLKKPYEIICRLFTDEKCAKICINLINSGLLAPLLHLNPAEFECLSKKFKALKVKLDQLGNKIKSTSNDKRNPDRILAHVLGIIYTTAFTPAELKEKLANWGNTANFYLYHLRLPPSCQTTLYAFLNGYIYSYEKNTNTLQPLLETGGFMHLSESSEYFKKLQAVVALRYDSLFVENNIIDDFWYLLFIKDTPIPPMPSLSFRSRSATILTNMPLTAMPFLPVIHSINSEVTTCQLINPDNTASYVKIIISNIPLLDYLEKFTFFGLEWRVYDLISNQYIIFRQSAHFDVQAQKLCSDKLSLAISKHHQLLLLYVSWGMHLGYYATEPQTQALRKFTQDKIEQCRREGRQSLPFIFEPKHLRYFFITHIVSEGQSAGYVSLLQHYGLLESVLSIQGYGIHNICTELESIDNKIKADNSGEKTALDWAVEISAPILYYGRHPNRTLPEAIKFFCKQLSLGKKIEQKIHDEIKIKYLISKSSFADSSNISFYQAPKLSLASPNLPKVEESTGIQKLIECKVGGSAAALFKFFDNRTLQASACVSKKFNELAKLEQEKRAGDTPVKKMGC